MRLKRRFFLLACALMATVVFAGGNVVEPIPTSASEISPLPVGASIPSLRLQTVEGVPVDLGAVVREKPSVLIFYRGGWCPYCNLQLGELQTVEAELQALGYQIIAISPDRPEKLGESVEKNELAYTLLSDHAMEAARALGIAFQVDGATLEKYKSYNIDIEAASGETHHLLPVPAVFIVGTDGLIQFSYANPDYTVRLSLEELLSAAKTDSAPAQEVAP